MATSALAMTLGAEAANERPQFIALGATTRAPIGWTDFCNENPHDCDGKPLEARDAVLTQKSWKELVRINKYVNDHVRPMTDIDHWGVVERWSYPDDGYGDCEDYVLLKRRMLLQAGFPRQALLITVVRDTKGEGHAVLTVKTDRGEFILDNQEERIMAWTETNYRFVKRQSQIDPNVWVALGDPRPAMATAASN
ncbi:MAG TPA: transglutaminase-like cysteine peptidase [Xanthobacteraceae bacterium]|nr:transglutaminase-like cysteine peptidase [Xanthobacteraceae bacterium]